MDSTSFRLLDDDGSSFVVKVLLKRVVQTSFSLGGFIIHHIPFPAAPTPAALGLIYISTLISYHDRQFSQTNREGEFSIPEANG